MTEKDRHVTIRGSKFKQSKPAGKLIPVHSQSGSLIGSMKGKVKVKGDIFSTGLPWTAASERVPLA